jgi:hypothetical protein
MTGIDPLTSMITLAVNFLLYIKGKDKNESNIVVAVKFNNSENNFNEIIENG